MLRERAEAARESFTKGMALLPESVYSDLRAGFLEELGRIELETGESAEARKHGKEASTLYEKLGDKAALKRLESLELV